MISRENDGRNRSRGQDLLPSKAPRAQLSAIWTKCQACRSEILGRHPADQLPAQERLGYPTQNPKPSSNASSKPPPTRATSSSTPSAAAAPPSRSPSASTAAGSASTSPTSPSASSSNGSPTPSARRFATPTKSSASRPTSRGPERTRRPTNKYQFQWWALGLVGARPAEAKRRAPTAESTVGFSSTTTRPPNRSKSSSP